MKLLEMLPDDYRQSEEIAVAQRAIGAEVEKAGDAKSDMILQLNINTATWGLALWEKIYGISPLTVDSLDTRRARVKSKMRARGVTTASMVQNVAESFIHGAASVIEHPEKYTFEIQFDATQQIPSNLAGLSAAIDEIKPAHLAYAYAYLFISKAMAGAFQTSGTTLTIYPYVAGNLETTASVYSGMGCFIASDILVKVKGE